MLTGSFVNSETGRVVRVTSEGDIFVLNAFAGENKIAEEETFVMFNHMTERMAEILFPED